MYRILYSDNDSEDNIYTVGRDITLYNMLHQILL